MDAPPKKTCPLFGIDIDIEEQVSMIYRFEMCLAFRGVSSIGFPGQTIIYQFTSRWKIFLSNPGQDFFCVGIEIISTLQ